MPNLNDYLNSVNAQQEYIKTIPTQREAGITKLKTDLGYADKMKNLEGINKQVFSTQQMLEDLPKNMQTRMAGRPVSNAQLSGLTSVAQEPLAGTLGKLSRTAQGEQTGVSNVLDELNNFRNTFSADTNSYLQGLQNQSAGLLNKYNADYTAYNDAQARAQAQAQAQAQAKQQADLYKMMNGSGAGVAQADTTFDKAGKDAEIRTGADGAKRVWDEGAGAWVSLDTYQSKQKAQYAEQTKGDLGKDFKDAFDVGKTWNSLGQAGKDIGELAQRAQNISQKNNQNWYDYVNPVKQSGNIWELLNSKR